MGKLPLAVNSVAGHCMAYREYRWRLPCAIQATGRLARLAMQPWCSYLS